MATQLKGKLETMVHLIGFLKEFQLEGRIGLLEQLKICCQTYAEQRSVPVRVTLAAVFSSKTFSYISNQYDAKVIITYALIAWDVMSDPPLLHFFCEIQSIQDGRNVLQNVLIPSIKYPVSMLVRSRINV